MKSIPSIFWRYISVLYQKMIPATYHSTHDRTLPPPDQGNGRLTVPFFFFCIFFHIFIYLFLLDSFIYVWEGAVDFTIYQTVLQNVDGLSVKSNQDLEKGPKAL